MFSSGISFVKKSPKHSGKCQLIAADFGRFRQRFLDDHAKKNKRFTYWKKFEWPSRSLDLSGVENMWPLLQAVRLSTDEAVVSQEDATERIE